ncbi:condensation domain-containing protein [Corynebacterium suicordis]|uniref:Condensation domain-containing protein n=1 Tax=Corynebacterium suicordis DSM 45110 TaxID=1121369 RepID=A0ABR9ZHY8_9CORY|nr:condensation domain-containing protein [Corynebacterium suicordis]MBF4552839.1 hypothetical protein [Corynebacterium suicordis DSM 45110]MDR6278202.1 hypothetical protein [Corynebacterium suicordis]
MEYSELSDYPLHTGRLTEWIPTAELGGWQSDERRLSPNHLAHLESVVNGGEDPEHNWIGTVFRIDGEYNKEAFSQAVTHWLRRHEALHTTVTFRDDKEIERKTLRPETISMRENPVEGELGAHIVNAHLSKYFANTLSALTWPHLTFATIEPTAEVLAEGGHNNAANWFTVIFAADHGVMDAYTQLFAIQELAEIYNAHLEQRLPALPECGSYVDFSEEESELASRINSEDDSVRAWQEFIARASDDHPEGEQAAPRFPLPHAVRDAEPQEQHTLSHWLLNADEAETFSSRCKKELGGSQSNGFLAAIKVAVNKLAGHETTRYVMPMHTRSRAELALAAGWFVGLMPVEDPMGEAQMFSHAVADTAVAVKRHKGAVSAPFNSLQPHLQGDSVPKFVVSYVDTRFVPGADKWTEHERALRSPNVSTDEVYFWILRNHNGVNISMRFPSNDEAKRSLEEFVKEYESILKTVVQQGDFSLAKAGK